MNECNAIHKYGNMKYDWDRIGSKPFQMTFGRMNLKIDLMIGTKNLNQVIKIEKTMMNYMIKIVGVQSLII